MMNLQTKERAAKYLEEIAQALGEEVEIKYSEFSHNFPWLRHKGLDTRFLEISEKRKNVQSYRGPEPSGVLYITVQIGYESGGGKKFNEKKATGMDIPAVIEYARERIKREIKSREISQRVGQIKAEINQKVKRVMNGDSYKVEPYIRGGEQWVQLKRLYLPVEQLEKFLEIAKENGWEV